MQDIALFPFQENISLYATFFVFVLAMLALDLGVFHRKAHTVSVRESVTWSIVWVGFSLAFAAGLYFFSGAYFDRDPRLLALPGFDSAVAAKQVTLEFLTGYVIEKALAVDNIFVFVAVFSAFSIPARFQHKVLFYGIIGALVFRALFIAAGSALLQYHAVMIVAGVFLIFTGVKIFFTATKATDPANNPVIRFARKFLPVSANSESGRFFVRENGTLLMTPLFLALLFIELSDIVFALDSVPAIFAVTSEPFIVLTSNVFAILGLRSLYFLLADAVDRFGGLKYGLGAILIFVGLKIVWLNEAFGGKFPIGLSLGIIAGILVASVAGSFLMKPKDSSGNGAG